MGVYELSGAGSLKTGRTLYTSMNANNQYGAMIPIASQVLSNAVVFGFSNIPSGYQDLMLVVNGVINSANTTQVIDNINGGVAFTGSSTLLVGNGSSASSLRNTSLSGFMPLTAGGAQLQATTSSVVIHFLNYSNTSTFKTVLFRIASDANGSGITSLGAGLISTTQAINTFNLSTQDGGRYWTSGTATLYGIRAVSS
jgi:hypothetical protein